MLHREHCELCSGHCEHCVELRVPTWCLLSTVKRFISGICHSPQPSEASSAPSLGCCGPGFTRRLHAEHREGAHSTGLGTRPAPQQTQTATLEPGPRQ